jgi:hypothetical protein
MLEHSVERVLVCLTASTRGHQLTYPSFKRQVLDELGADLALAIAIEEKRYDYTNSFWQNAKYRWTAPTFRADYGEAYDLVQRRLCQQRDIPPPDWRSMLRIKGFWQGGIQSKQPQRSSSALLPFCRWLLLDGLRQDKVLDRYDRFIITRSDFFWLCPHPPLSVLDQDAIWVPDGEDYGGVNDRHLVASRSDVESCLDVIEDVLLHPIELYEEIKDQPQVNNEFLLAHHLERRGLLQKVKRFPSVMYLARELNDYGPTYSGGRYDGSAGHFVKYKSEFRAAKAYSTIIHSRADWENRGWMQFDPTSVKTKPSSLPLRFRYTCETLYFTIRSELRRPGGIERVVRFCTRMLGQLFGRPASS